MTENDIKFLLGVLSGGGHFPLHLSILFSGLSGPHAAQTQSVFPLEAKYGCSIPSINPAFDGCLWDIESGFFPPTPYLVVI